MVSVVRIDGSYVPLSSELLGTCDIDGKGATSAFGLLDLVLFFFGSSELFLPLRP